MQRHWLHIYVREIQIFVVFLARPISEHMGHAHILQSLSTCKKTRKFREINMYSKTSIFWRKFREIHTCRPRKRPTRWWSCGKHWWYDFVYFCGCNRGPQCSRPGTPQYPVMGLRPSLHYWGRLYPKCARVWPEKKIREINIIHISKNPFLKTIKLRKLFL